MVVRDLILRALSEIGEPVNGACIIRYINRHTRVVSVYQAYVVMRKLLEDRELGSYEWPDGDGRSLFLPEWGDPLSYEPKN